MGSWQRSLRSKRFHLVSEHKRPRKGIFGFDRARNETTAKKGKRGEGEGKEGNLPALLLGPFFARSLTLVPLSLLIDRTETLATQAIGNVV